MATDHVRDLVLVTISTDPDDPRLQSAVEGLGPKRAALVVSAAFAYAVLERWPEGASLDEIHDFVRTKRNKVASDEKPQQLAAEGLIRSILKEEDLATELPSGIIFQTQLWLVYEIVKSLYNNETDCANFVEEAHKLANQWLANMQST